MFSAFSVFDQPRDVMNINEPSTRRNWRQTLIHYGDKLLFLATSCRKLNMLNFGNLSPETSNLSPETATCRRKQATCLRNLSPATSCWNLSIVYDGLKSDTYTRSVSGLIRSTGIISGLTCAIVVFLQNSSTVLACFSVTKEPWERTIGIQNAFGTPVC